MSADLVAIAEAAASSLAAAYAATPRRLSQDVAVERVFNPRWKIDQLTDWNHADPAAKAIRVTVLPLSEETAADERRRGLLVVRYVTYVAVTAKPKTTDNADVDPLLLLLQEVRDYFFRTNPAYLLSGRQERAVAIETLNHPTLETLIAKRHFVGDCLITFQGVRTV